MTDSESPYLRAKKQLKELKERMDYSNIVRTGVEPNSIEKICSFCGKDSHAREVLIEGPAIFICNVCVRLCQDILDAKGVQ